MRGITTSRVEVATIMTTQLGIAARHRCGVASHELYSIVLYSTALYFALIALLLTQVTQV